MTEEKRGKFVNSMIHGLNAGIPSYVGVEQNDKTQQLLLYAQRRSYSVTRFQAEIMGEKGSLYRFDERSKDFVCIFRKGDPEKPKKNALLLMNQDGQYLLSSKDSFIRATVYVQAIPSVAREGEQPKPIALWARFQKQPETDIDIKNHVVAITSDYNLVWLLDAFADTIQNGQENNGNVPV